MMLSENAIFSENPALFTDAYQIAMMLSYQREQKNEIAVFELYFRGMPSDRQFYVMAGLESLIEFLTHLHFREEDIDWLKSLRIFDNQALSALKDFRFTGDLEAFPEGRIFFGDEPVLRIRAPLAQAQFIETRLINLIHCAVTLASKAARCTVAAHGKSLVDMGFRRAYGAEAGVIAARSSYIAGFSGTATVAATALYDIPLIGTMAHSFVQAHASEEEAFLQFALTYPNNVVLLIDTYDTLKAAEKVVRLAPVLKEKNIQIRAVRIDSGDLVELSKTVREMFDNAGLLDIKIYVSGDLDEYKIQELLAAHAPIDSFGIGTRLVTPPALSAVYKLQERNGEPCAKFSPGKASTAGARDVFRIYDDRGKMQKDMVTCYQDKTQGGESLFLPVIREGKRVCPQESLAQMRKRFESDLNALPDAFKQLDVQDAAHRYPVEVSAALRDRTEVMRKRLT